MLAVVWLGLAPPADAQSARLPVRIVTYDYAGVEPAVIERARTVVSRVFGELGVDPAWMLFIRGHGPWLPTARERVAAMHELDHRHRGPAGRPP